MPRLYNPDHTSSDSYHADYLCVTSLNGLSDHDHICVIRPQWVKWQHGIIPAIYASHRLNGLDDGLVWYMCHQASTGYMKGWYNVCVTRIQRVKWWVGIIRTIYVSLVLNGLSVGLIAPRSYRYLLSSPINAIHLGLFQQPQHYTRIWNYTSRNLWDVKYRYMHFGILNRSI